MATADLPSEQRPPWWRSVRTLRLVGQVVFVLVVFGFLYFLWFNLVTNLNRAGIGLGFGWLRRPGGIGITGTSLRPFSPNWQLILAAVKNTALISGIGILLALVLGTFIGVLRLSGNWLVARFASLYVESLRNIPVLIIILFWFVAVVLQLPDINAAIVWFDAAILSVKGLWIPWLRPDDAAGVYGLMLVAGLATAFGVGWWRTRVHDRTGAPHHRILWGMGILLVTAVAGYVALGRPVAVDVPALAGRSVEGGFRVTPEYAALTIALVLYTASHIAEIVRGAILAVPKGQTEAATAVGLGPFQRLRFVILPQAFRIAVPPTGNQFLNLTKNSSLGVAIGMPEVTQVIRQIIGNGYPAPQAIAVMMGIYLAFSLTISAVTNLVNRRLQVQER